MKPALEVAKEIMAEFYAQFGYISSSNKEQVALIAEALTQFAEERVKEARTEILTTMKIDISGFEAKARAEALEEAAKVADRLTAELDEETDKVFSQKFKQAIKTMNGSVVSEECAVRIRALKEKP